MLCSTRSNPLTHITRARYLFAALLLLILTPGAGRYPWLAVAGIYAPVAVVCAVGVWRAARPRPEALT